MLGCGGSNEDSLEHYFHCAAIQQVARTYLRIGPVTPNMFLLVENMPNDLLLCLGILVYASYCGTSLLRGKMQTTSLTAVGVLEQCCRNAVQGHAESRVDHGPV